MKEGQENAAQLPAVKRSCFDCIHYSFGFRGEGYCERFDERIDSEIFAASDCEEYRQP